MNRIAMPDDGAILREQAESEQRVVEEHDAICGAELVEFDGQMVPLNELWAQERKLLVRGTDGVLRGSYAF